MKGWLTLSGLPVRKFFNTSGVLYKSLGLKEKLPSMSEDECLELLATDGMLVKRPLLVDEHRAQSASMMACGCLSLWSMAMRARSEQ